MTARECTKDRRRKKQDATSSSAMRPAAGERQAAKEAEGGRLGVRFWPSKLLWLYFWKRKGHSTAYLAASRDGEADGTQFHAVSKDKCPQGIKEICSIISLGRISVFGKVFTCLLGGGEGSGGKGGGGL